MPGKHLGLLSDALIKQQIIITQYFYEFPSRSFDAAQEVLCKPQGFSVSQIIHRHARQPCERLDNLLDSIIFTVITDDDFQILIRLT
ncbi:hypothetical protein D3C76_628710 [compost metagenome]